MSTVMDEKMGRKKNENPIEKTTTKIEVELLRFANIVALHKKMDLFDYLDGILRPVVKRDYEDFKKTKDSP